MQCEEEGMSSNTGLSSETQSQAERTSMVMVLWMESLFPLRFSI